MRGRAAARLGGVNGDPFRSAPTAAERAAARRRELRQRLVETARDFVREEWRRDAEFRRVLRSMAGDTARMLVRAGALAALYFGLRWLIYVVLSR